MKHLFTPGGDAALRALLGRDTLIALDFDGTLSPIVSQPGLARASAGIMRQLRALDELATVAVVTGRGLTDIEGLLAFRPSYMIGNHGLEGLPGQEECYAQAHSQCRAWLAQLEAQPALEDAVPGLMLEDKSLSISIHYRLARNRDDAMAAIETRLKALHPPPRIIGGHCVVNLLPHEAPDKGQAVKQLLKASGCRNVLYVGDDETDESVFRCAERDWLTVRVGLNTNSTAEYLLNHQSEVATLLQKVTLILGAMDGRGVQTSA